MPTFAIILIIVAAVALIIWGAMTHAKRERIRVAGLTRWASANGFSFAPRDPFNLDARLRGIGEIGRGHDRYAVEVLARDQPAAMFCFRYHFKTWETRTVRRGNRTYTERYEKTHWRSYLVVELQAGFPSLTLRPENLFDRVAGFVGFDDIDFESESFSREYFVKSRDRQFAYALIHPQMMEWMTGRKLAVELEQGCLVIDTARHGHSAEGLSTAMGQVSGLVNRIPDFVWQDYGKRSPLKLPEPVAVEPVVETVNA